MYRILQRLGLLTFAAILVLALFLAFTPQGRAALHTTLFISQTVPAIPAQTWLQPDPMRTRVSVPTPDGMREADLYRPPGDGPYSATVLFLGVAPAGPHDPRVVGLANGLARAGMVTLVYWSPEKLSGQIHPPDIQNLVAAFLYLQGKPFVDPRRVGYAGFCVGASFVLMAAAQPKVREQVAFVNAFGPYYQMVDLARAIGTRSTTDHQHRRIMWEPDKLALSVTAKLLLEALDLGEAERVRGLLNAGDARLPAALSTEGRAVLRLLVGGTPEQIEDAVNGLPTELLDKMAAVSPKNYVLDISAPILVMHDRADMLVPSAESRRLVMAIATAEHDQLRYTEFSLFQHMDPSRTLGLLETMGELNKLFWHLYAILRQAS